MFSNVGQTLSLLRELRGKSQARLAKDAGIGKSQRSKYENNRELPKLESLEKVLKALQISYFEFFYTLCVIDRRVTDLKGAGAKGPAAKGAADRGAAAKTVAGEEPAFPLPPFLSSETLLAEDTGQAFNQVFSDLLLLYRRVFEQMIISGQRPPRAARRRRARIPS